MINVMQGAVAAAMMQAAKQPTDKVVAIAALSALTPGILGLALPILALNARKADSTTIPAPEKLPAPLILVPDMLGRTEKEAVAALQAQGFGVTVEVRGVDGADFGPGQVAFQDPQADDAVEQRSTVRLTVLPGEPDSGKAGSFDAE